MEFKLASRKGALILSAAVTFAIGVPLIGFTEWRYFKYCFLFFVGAFFFLMVNRLGDGRGVTITAILIGWLVPLTGIPYIHSGLYADIIKPEYFGPLPVELIIYSFPAIIGLAYLLSGHKDLSK